MKRALAGCLALLIVSAGVAYAVSDTTKEAAKIFNKALNETVRLPVCREEPPPATLIHDPPSQDLLATLSVLRRPATPADAVSTQRLMQLPFIGNVFVDYVRVVRTADGRSYGIVPVRTAPPPPEPHACLHAVHKRLLRLLKGKSRGVRRRALAFFNGFVDLQHQLANFPATDGVFVFHYEKGRVGAGGGGGDVDVIRQRGEWGFAGTRSGGTIVDGLVPDPVASVTTYYSRKAHRRGRPPKVYPKAIKRTDPVSDNMVSFRVQRDVQDAVRPVKMIWRAADGSIVRVVRVAR